MFGLSALGTKLIIAGIIVTVITATVGGFFLYQERIVSGMQETIDTQAGEITTLKGNIIKLKASNISLETQITNKSEETKDAYAEITRLREVDVASSIRVNEVERILRDRNRNERLASIRKSRKASLILRLMDKAIICEVANFYDINGRCVRGKWVPDGGRLVPKVEKTTNETQ